MKLQRIFSLSLSILAASALFATAADTDTAPVGPPGAPRGGRRGAPGGGKHVPLPVPSLKYHVTGQTPPSADGFLQRWMILEPISIGNQQPEAASKAAVKTEYFPNQLTILPKDGDKVSFGGADYAWHSLDTLKHRVNLYHFGYELNKPSAGVIFWAVTIVNCPEEMHNVRLAVGSNASSVWWVNGEEVIGIYGDIQTIIDDGISKHLTLKKGQNVIRGAIINGSGATDFCARFLDQNDKPLTKGFTLSVPEK